MARHIPQADAALKGGTWARSRWTGVELAGKTLGILGLGRIGTMVAQRMLAFGMRVIAYDPHVPDEHAAALQVGLRPLGELLRESDFLTIHMPRTSETVGLIGADQLRSVKPELRIVNAARGGIIDEPALYSALRDGSIAGAGLDVFEREPCTDSPLFRLPNVVVTPHLGASSAEAQEKAGVAAAHSVLLALAGTLAPDSVNTLPAAGSRVLTG